MNLTDDQKSLTVSEFIKTGLKYQTNMRKPKFGIKYYKIQGTETYDPYYKIPNNVKATGMQKQRGCFMDDFLYYNKDVPAAKYNVLDDWNKKFDTNTGKFLKSEKVTFTGEIMNKSKKHRPCPGFYKFKAPSDEPMGFAKRTFSLEQKGCSFIDETKRLSSLTPGSKYQLNEK